MKWLILAAALALCMWCVYEAQPDLPFLSNGKKWCSMYALCVGLINYCEPLRRLSWEINPVSFALFVKLFHSHASGLGFSALDRCWQLGLFHKTHILSSFPVLACTTCDFYHHHHQHHQHSHEELSKLTYTYHSILFVLYALVSLLTDNKGCLYQYYGNWSASCWAIPACQLVISWSLWLSRQQVYAAPSLHRSCHIPGLSSAE